MSSSVTDSSFILKRNDKHKVVLLKWIQSLNCDIKSFSQLQDGFFLWNIINNLSAQCHNFVNDSNDGIINVVSRLCQLLDIQIKRGVNHFYNKFNQALSDDNEHFIHEVIQLLMGYAFQNSCKKDECVAYTLALSSEEQYIMVLEIDTAVKRISHLKSIPATPVALQNLVSNASLKKSMRKYQAICDEN